MVQARIEIPVRLLQRFVETERTLALLSDEFEDVLFSRNPAFLKRMRAARRAHLAGRTRSFQAFSSA